MLYTLIIPIPMIWIIFGIIQYKLVEDKKDFLGIFIFFTLVIYIPFILMLTGNLNHLGVGGALFVVYIAIFGNIVILFNISVICLKKLFTRIKNKNN